MSFRITLLTNLKFDGVSRPLKEDGVEEGGVLAAAAAAAEGDAAAAAAALSAGSDEDDGRWCRGVLRKVKYFS